MNNARDSRTYEDLTLFEIDPDLQDEADRTESDEVRALVFDLPARPGTRR